MNFYAETTERLWVEAQDEPLPNMRQMLMRAFQLTEDNER